jgi:ParB family chromosome partitioning protein
MLAELIHAEGVLQNLSVYECPPRDGESEDRYAVIAGGRRLRAMQRLIEQGRITTDYAAPCLIVSYERAVEISLAENSAREPMHPADEFEAFKSLIDAGRTIEDVAARFGVAPIVVQRRLKLANVHPTFIALYRDSELTLEDLMALAVTDDHGRQLAVWKGLKEYERSPSTIRRALTEHELSLRDPVARFVGLKAYEKAGGAVRRDLFAEEDGEVGLDAALVRKLATAKLEKCADKLRKEGAPWVHVFTELDYAARAAYGRVQRVYRDPTDEEQSTLDEIAAERARIDREIEDVGDDEERLVELEQRAAELEEQCDAMKDKCAVPDPEQLALAGALVSIGPDGKVRIDRGVLKPEDASRFAKGKSGRDRAAVAQSGPRVHSAALVRRLTAQCTLALQATLAERPEVALTALTHRLLQQAFPLYGCGGDSVVRIDGKRAELEPYGADLEGCPAQTALRARREAIEARLPNDPEQLFTWLIEQPQSEVLSLLAFCVSLTLDAVQSDEAASPADELARAAGLDMRTWWAPTAKGYLACVSKACILEIVREAVSPEVAAAISQMKKGPLAEAAERRLAGTGWLPTLLRTGS